MGAPRQEKTGERSEFDILRYIFADAKTLRTNGLKDLFELHIIIKINHAPVTMGGKHYA
jgi:hypothetical protein